MIHSKRSFGHSFVALFCLIILFCIMLTACSLSEKQITDRTDEQQQVVDHPDEQQKVDRPDAGGQSQHPSQGEGEQQVTVGSDGIEQSSSDLTEDILFSALIRINPIFEIQVGNDECVVALIPHNSDGKQVCEGLEAVGMPYLDAVYAVTDLSVRKGFLETGDMIEIILTFREASEQTMFAYDMEIHGIINRCAESHHIANLQFCGGCGTQFFVENEDPDWSPEKDSLSASQPGHASNQEILETDANGRVTHYIEHQDDYTIEFFTDGNGNNQKIILRFTNGIVITQSFHSNGNIAEEIQDTDLGEHITTHFDTNGMIQNQQTITADGLTINSTYYANGRPASVIADGLDGFHREVTYSEDGLTEHIIENTGYEAVRTYYEDGTLAMTKDVYSNSTLEEHYDTSGNLSLSIIIGNDGRRTETHWNPDKSGSMTQFGLDGSSSTVYFRPDGKVTHGYDSNGNYYEETGEVYAGTKNGGKG